MARGVAGGKGNVPLTVPWHDVRMVRDMRGHQVGADVMGMMAIAMFVALFAFGRQLFSWTDSDGDVQLALIASFLLGVIAAFRNR